MLAWRTGLRSPPPNYDGRPCDAQILPVIFRGPSVPLDMGMARRKASPSPTRGSHRPRPGMHRMWRQSLLVSIPPHHPLAGRRPHQPRQFVFALFPVPPQRPRPGLASCTNHQRRLPTTPTTARPDTPTRPQKPTPATSPNPTPGQTKKITRTTSPSPPIEATKKTPAGRSVTEYLAQEHLGAGMAGVGEELRGGALFDYLALVEQHDAVCHFPGEAHLVGDSHDGHPGPG